MIIEQVTMEQIDKHIEQFRIEETELMLQGTYTTKELSKIMNTIQDIPMLDIEEYKGEQC